MKIILLLSAIVLLCGCGGDRSTPGPWDVQSVTNCQYSYSYGQCDVVFRDGHRGYLIKNGY